MSSGTERYVFELNEITAAGCREHLTSPSFLRHHKHLSLNFISKNIVSVLLKTLSSLWKWKFPFLSLPESVRNGLLSGKSQTKSVQIGAPFKLLSLMI